MASDFGDDAGGELYNWLLRIGQDAGEQAMRDAAGKFAGALRNLRSGAERADELAPEADEMPRWAKLDMAEIDELPDAAGARRALSERMDDAGVEHAYVNDPSSGRSYLLFRTEDAPRLYSCIDELLEEIGAQAEAVAEEISRDEAERPSEKGREGTDLARDQDDPDKEPLEKRAEAAREASEQLERERGSKAPEREPRFQEVRGK